MDFISFRPRNKYLRTMPVLSIYTAIERFNSRICATDRPFSINDSMPKVGSLCCSFLRLFSEVVNNLLIKFVPF